MFGIFVTLAEFERELIRERTMAGLEAARARVQPRTMTPAKLRTAMAMMADRDNVARDVAEQLGVSLSALDADADGKARPKECARQLLAAPPQRRAPAALPMRGAAR